MIDAIILTGLLSLAVWLSIKISIADFRRRIIPDAYLFPLMLIGLTCTTFFHIPTNIESGIFGAIFGYIISCVIGYTYEYMAQRRGAKYDTPIGMGDIKLISIGGLWLGTTGLSIALIISCIIGTLWGHKNRQRFIPFAPFFLIGGFLAFLGKFFLL